MYSVFFGAPEVDFIHRKSRKITTDHETRVLLLLKDYLQRLFKFKGPRVMDIVYFQKAYIWPEACFLKALETFRARGAIFSSSVFKITEVYTPETSCKKGNSLHFKNM